MDASDGEDNMGFSDEVLQFDGGGEGQFLA